MNGRPMAADHRRTPSAPTATSAPSRARPASAVAARKSTDPGTRARTPPVPPSTTTKRAREPLPVGGVDVARAVPDDVGRDVELRDPVQVGLDDAQSTAPARRATRELIASKGGVATSLISAAMQVPSGGTAPVQPPTLRPDWLTDQ